MKILIFIVLLLFVSCSNIDDKISYAKIENNLNNLESLNKNEILIAKDIVEDSNKNNYQLITSKELNAIIDMKNLVLIAVMPRAIYNLGFIKGSKNFEFNASFSEIWEDDTKRTESDFLDFLGDKNNKIIFYDNADNSARVAILWTKKLGYKNIHLLAGNFMAWKENNFLVSFDAPECCKM